MKPSIIKLSSRTRIRKEYFGGILFNMDTGDVVEVDREAFHVITVLKDAEIADIRNLADLPVLDDGHRVDSRKITSVLSRLITQGIINEMPAGVLTGNYKKALEEKSKIQISWPACEQLSAPETVHWAVTYRCDNHCPDCYVERHRRQVTGELDTEGAMRLIDKIAGSGVFQLAIGGGEPFARTDLEDIVRRAWGKGLVVHLTTGKYEIEEKRLAKLASSLKTLQIGIRTDELLCQTKDVVEKLRELVKKLDKYRVNAGANLIMTQASINNLDRIVEILINTGIKQYTLLRYKPPGNRQRWLQEKPDKAALLLLEEKLSLLQEKNPELLSRIDCALSFLERRLNPHTALRSGIRGCVAFDRILSIAPDGSVYPCSQLVGAAFNAGNLLNDDFETIWNESTAARRYRHFRDSRSFLEGSCGKCKARAFCGGCRIFAHDAVGSDPGCPEPVFGKKKGTGKRLDEDNYPSWLRDSGCSLIAHVPGPV